MIYRLFVVKKPGYDIKAQNLLKDLTEIVNVQGLTGIKIVNRYDIEGISETAYNAAKLMVFSEAPTDIVLDGEYPIAPSEYAFAVKYLPGQYDQRSDSAEQCIMTACGESVRVESASLYVCAGEISMESAKKIENYCINPVDSMKAPLEKPESLFSPTDAPNGIPVLSGFINMSEAETNALAQDMGLAMTGADLNFCREYFREDGRRDPTFTEIKVIDTYWSDHCRHTTFLTEITDIEIEDGPYAPVFNKALELYRAEKLKLSPDKPVCLMDIAVMGMKSLKSRGLLQDLDESDEINACSIVVPANVNGKAEDWLVMFKNETHNHPTEIEPFGGAATCLGGAIRDPLSGRSYVYQAMRVTGCGDPRAPLGNTLPGKLPQRKLTLGAAQGFSSYGNQIGLAAGQISEIYDEGYTAKRMEIGAVVGAAPKSYVKRGEPAAGDVVILVGGRTGRDGCGGATGSSKSHTEQSILSCGAEVQKGNPLTERHLQRLFRNPKASLLIKRCNDFGAGGVAVAIGELAAGLDIDLDAVPKKYEGLDGTELAISESQERMAVVVSSNDAVLFIALANNENLEAVIVAKVTDSRQLVMRWRGKTIVDLSRSFLDTNGVRQKASALIASPSNVHETFKDDPAKWLDNLSDINIALQKGLSEHFDSTVGSGTVLMPFGGFNQLTPPDAMVAKLPVNGETDTSTIMSYGFDPKLSRRSPFHGAVCAVVEALAKLAATGGDYKLARLSFQEYYERMSSPEKWGKPLAALLGALTAQVAFEAPAIGGKDSMSGSFNDLHVPPTLVAFALAPGKANEIISPEFKKPRHLIALINSCYDEYGMPNFVHLRKMFDTLHELIVNGRVLAASSIGRGGVAASVSKMAIGNGVGARLEPCRGLYAAAYGSIVIETDLNTDEACALGFETVGATICETAIFIGGHEIPLNKIEQALMSPLESVFPTGWAQPNIKAHCIPKARGLAAKRARATKIFAAPRVLIPVFPGTNGEYDMAGAFERAGGVVGHLIIRNLNRGWLGESIKQLAEFIRQSQIVAMPGGFSAGDEPDGSGKYIAAVFACPEIREAINDLLKNRGGLILGICNGFQALLKIGLLTNGEISPLTSESPVLAVNSIGRHVSCMIRTRVVSNKSPWLWNVEPGDEHIVPISHGEGRFTASENVLGALAANGQIASQYTELDGEPSMAPRFNPNGSDWAIEGISSPDGHVLGKMGHSERAGGGLYKNIPGYKASGIFEAGVGYFR